MFYFLASLWFVRQIKNFLFWFYLWQLKNYYWRRFIVHFQTIKGKKLFFNWLFLTKVILFFYALGLAWVSLTITLPIVFFVWWILLLIGFYLLELFKLIYDFIRHNFKKPIFTFKITLLFIFSVFIQILFLIILFQQFYFIYLPNLYWFTFVLLIFDISTPFLASLIILISEFFINFFFRKKIFQQARKKREQLKNLLAISVIGSYGKTSTKEFLAEILSQKYPVLKTKENQNSDIGVAQCILRELTPNHKIFISEMTSDDRKGVNLLCDIVQPQIGVITGINEQHLAVFGSMENLLFIEGGRALVNYLSEKKEKIQLNHHLIEPMVFLNGKNRYCLEFYEKITGLKKVLYGQEASYLGQENILGAIKIAQELGVEEEKIKLVSQKLLEQLPSVKIKSTKEDFKVIDASYSSNPTGVLAHLDYLTKNWPENKKIIIMPCLIELGKAGKKIHQEIGQKINEVCDLAIITTKDYFKEIKKEAGEKVIFLEKPKLIVNKIREIGQKGDVILLEGRVPSQIIKLLGL